MEHESEFKSSTIQHQLPRSSYNRDRPVLRGFHITYVAIINTLASQDCIEGGCGLGQQGRYWDMLINLQSNHFCCLIIRYVGYHRMILLYSSRPRAVFLKLSTPEFTWRRPRIGLTPLILIQTQQHNNNIPKEDLLESKDYTKSTPLAFKDYRRGIPLNGMVHWGHIGLEVQSMYQLQAILTMDEYLETSEVKGTFSCSRHCIHLIYMFSSIWYWP